VQLKLTPSNGERHRPPRPCPDPHAAAVDRETGRGRVRREPGYLASHGERRTLPGTAAPVPRLRALAGRRTCRMGRGRLPATA
jgi:hypothetical protein